MIKTALEYFGYDYEFAHSIPGLPTKLSDVKGLEIGSFQTNDGVKLTYWKAGKGTPLVFVPGWSSNGAEYINLIHLLKDKYEVYVLDQRNHGLSDKVTFGNRISRLSADLNDMLVSLDIRKAHLCGWSMGCSVIWSYIDLFGNGKIEKLVFIDEAASIYCHSDWTEEQRINAGAFTTSAEAMISMYYGKGPSNRLVVNTDIMDFYTVTGAPAFENSHTFAEEMVPPDMAALELVLFDHILNDWRDVLTQKISNPVLVVSGEHSNWVESQRWIAETVSDGRVIIYDKKNNGDHFLHLKEPLTFTRQLHEFLSK
ncbi:alpha/beta fold hydrolase [Pseudescherichia vulneris]|uniref:alpha/beta fold hydrolase n=1 Tax=Pseudescherichia vulneris TaxID=566 RepID=UPI0028B0B0EE|nr:alpha/beta hydrolase [Pseudescherichia vulneris]